MINSAELRTGPKHAEAFRGDMRVLIIEDDKETAGFLAKGLKESGFTPTVATDGKEGLLLAASEDFDVAIVDRMLPGLDGLSLVETLRRTGKEFPVLFLSAMGSVEERVRGLRGGADDYLVKPFAFSELLARIEVLLRRGSGSGAETTLRVGGLEMDLLAREVRRDGQAIDLQPREFKILEYMMRHAGRVVTRVMLLENVWNYHFDPQTNVVDVHISRLRQKIDKGFDTALLHTVRGAGYCLREPRDHES